MFTGVILDTDNQIRVPNNLHFKINNDREQFDVIDEMSKIEKDKFKKKLYGRVISAKTIEPNVFPELIKKVKSI